MKTRQLSIATLMCALGAFSAQAETLGEAVEKCRKTEDSLKRLICYDGVAKSLNQYDGLNEQLSQMKAYKPGSSAQVRTDANAQSQVSPQPAPAAKPVNEFGLENKRNKKEVSEIALTITSIKKNLRDKYVISFSDDSVWQQTDGNYIKLEEGQSVTVERGFLGSFFLSVEGLNKRIKVKRIK
ncbi:hypothetical protein [Alteromonas gracilis]|uniref:hypothetical protein n=1 Tax=Alteromonas gracilis TaxID=1479524 RepID=UPI0037363CE1